MSIREEASEMYLQHDEDHFLVHQQKSIGGAQMFRNLCHGTKKILQTHRYANLNFHQVKP